MRARRDKSSEMPHRRVELIVFREVVISSDVPDAG